MTPPPYRTLHRRNQGMAMVAILAVVVLLGTFMVLAGHLFAQAMAITRDGARLEQDAVQLDAFIRQLRLDVWQAEQIDVASENQLQLERGDAENTVSWRITRDDRESAEPTFHITRQAATSDSNPARFTLRLPVRVASDGASVHLHVADQRVTLISQHRLLEVQP